MTVKEFIKWLEQKDPEAIITVPSQNIDGCYIEIDEYGLAYTKRSYFTYDENWNKTEKWENCVVIG